ncbi:MAG: OmpA family protein [Oligoflexales bacterium]
MNDQENNISDGSLMNSVKNLITPDFVATVSNHLGESPHAVTKGIGAAIPALLGSIVHKFSSANGADNLIDIVRSPSFSQYTKPSLAGRSENVSFLTKILGDNLGNVSRIIQNISGISAEKIASLLGMIAPLVMGVVGEKVRNFGFDATSVMNYFGQQKSSISASLPEGMQAFFHPGEHTMGTMVNPGGDLKRRVGIPTWAKVVAVALAVVGAFAILRNRGRPVDELTQRTEEPAKPFQGSREESSLKVHEFFSRAKVDGDHEKLALENITFLTGTAELTPDARVIVEEVATQLSDHPGVRIRLDGHTDDTGDAGSNKALSLARANAVRRALTERGIDGGRIEVMGWGAEHPVVANSSETGRQQNRRIEIILLEPGEETEEAH